MSPFIEKETQTRLPRGKTELATDVYLLHPDNRPEDEALIVLENCGEFRPASVDIVGREGQDIFINPHSRKEPIILTWEPAIEIQAARIIWDREYERYFPLTDKVYTYIKRKMENMSELKKFAVTGVFTFPFIGAMVSDLVLMAPRRANDFLTKYWQKERAVIETELKEKKGLASGR